MRGMRLLQLAMFFALMFGAGRAHAIIHLELEGGGGLALRGPQAPMGTARVGLNVLSLLDVGLRAEGVFGSAPQSLCGNIDGCGISGYRAWMVFPELRLRTPTPIVKVDLALGGGLGYLDGINLTHSTYDSNGSAKPYGQVGLGVRLDIPTTDVYVRAEGSVSLFTGVTGPDVGNGVDSGLLPIWQVQLMLGYAGIGF